MKLTIEIGADLDEREIVQLGSALKSIIGVELSNIDDQRDGFATPVQFFATDSEGNELGKVCPTCNKLVNEEPEPKNVIPCPGCGHDMDLKGSTGKCDNGACKYFGSQIVFEGN